MADDKPSWVSVDPRATARAAGFTTGGIPTGIKDDVAPTPKPKVVVKEKPTPPLDTRPTGLAGQRITQSYADWLASRGLKATVGIAGQRVTPQYRAWLEKQKIVSPRPEPTPVYNIPIADPDKPPSVANIEHHKKRAALANLKVVYSSLSKPGKTRPGVLFQRGVTEYELIPGKPVPVIAPPIKEKPRAKREFTLLGAMEEIKKMSFGEELRKEIGLDVSYYTEVVEKKPKREPPTTFFDIRREKPKEKPEDWPLLKKMGLEAFIIDTKDKGTFREELKKDIEAYKKSVDKAQIWLKSPVGVKEKTVKELIKEALPEKPPRRKPIDLYGIEGRPPTPITRITTTKEELKEFLSELKPERRPPIDLYGVEGRPPAPLVGITPVSIKAELKALKPERRKPVELYGVEGRPLTPLAKTTPESIKKEMKAAFEEVKRKPAKRGILEEDIRSVIGLAGVTYRPGYITAKVPKVGVGLPAVIGAAAYLGLRKRREMELEKIKEEIKAPVMPTMEVVRHELQFPEKYPRGFVYRKPTKREEERREYPPGFPQEFPTRDKLVKKYREREIYREGYGEDYIGRHRYPTGYAPGYGLPKIPRKEYKKEVFDPNLIKTELDRATLQRTKLLQKFKMEYGFAGPPTPRIEIPRIVPFGFPKRDDEDDILGLTRRRRVRPKFGYFERKRPIVGAVQALIGKKKARKRKKLKKKKVIKKKKQKRKVRR